MEDDGATDEASLLLVPPAEVAVSAKTNINVRSAFIHVLGDFVQSVGVCIASIIIWLRPEYTIADPICTFIFSVLVLLTTLQILHESLWVLMEGVPRELNVTHVRETLARLPGVAGVHALHIWSLTVGRAALAVHLLVADDANPDRVLKLAQSVLGAQYGIHHSTVQIERTKAATASVPCADMSRSSSVSNGER